MARAVYSKTFLEPTVLASGGIASATVPAGYVWKVKWISALLSAGGSGYLEIIGPTGYNTFVRLPVPDGSKSYQLDIEYVLTAGQTLYLYANGTGLVVYASGYQLVSP